MSDSDVATVSGVGQQKSIAKVKTTALGAVEASLTVILILELAGLVNKVQTYGMTVLGSDMQYYLDVATRLGQGQLPYRDFVFEYPPGALIPMVVADVVSMASGSGIGGYVAALFIVNFVLVAATAACLVFLARRGWAAESTSRTVITYALLCLATPVLFFRFDSFPTLLMVLSLVLFATSRVALAGVAAGAVIQRDADRSHVFDGHLVRLAGVINEDLDFPSLRLILPNNAIGVHLSAPTVKCMADFFPKWKLLSIGKASASTKAGWMNSQQKSV